LICQTALGIALDGLASWFVRISYSNQTFDLSPFPIAGWHGFIISYSHEIMADYSAINP
jgi:hypothetical protein